MAAKKRPAKSAKRKVGPKPERLKIEGDWKDAVAQALKKGRPPKEK
jgi:hypothetical protein